MSANNVISLPGVANATRSAATRSPSAALSLLLSDFIVLSTVFWLAVWSKYTFNPDLHLKFYLEVFPSILLFLSVFFSQGLYPALLLHPAEEMRRLFHSVTAVLLVLVSATFLMKNGAEYSRYVFLFTWALGVVAPVGEFACDEFQYRALCGRGKMDLQFELPSCNLSLGVCEQHVALVSLRD